MSLLRQTAKRLLTTCVPSRWLLTRGQPHGPGERPRLALTFDDGPHPIHTPRVLDLLEAAGLKATFFVVGREAALHPDLILRIAAEGHELGNHTWSHGEPARTSAREFLDEVCRTDELLFRLTGCEPSTMRPPKGELNWTKMSGLWRRGRTVALWNVDPRDYRITDPAEIAAWTARYQPHDGDLLLFHDNHPWAAAAIDRLIGDGVFKRFQAVTVATMTGRPQAPPKPIPAATPAAELLNES